MGRSTKREPYQSHNQNDRRRADGAEGNTARAGDELVKLVKISSICIFPSMSSCNKLIRVLDTGSFDVRWVRQVSCR